MIMYRSFRLLLRVMLKLFYRLATSGVHNVPDDGPVILCANHISNWDPPIVGVCIHRKVYYMAKEELFHIPVFSWVIKKLGAFPVKRGGVSKESIRSAVRLLQGNAVLGVFPEGSRHAAGAAKKGAASLALRSGATVIPVAIIGEYKLFQSMRVVYGNPVDLSEFDSDMPDRLEKATAKIMESIYDLIEKNR